MRKHLLLIVVLLLMGGDSKHPMTEPHSGTYVLYRNREIMEEYLPDGTKRVMSKETTFFLGAREMNSPRKKVSKLRSFRN